MIRPALRFDKPSVQVLAPVDGWCVYRIYDAEGLLIYAGATAGVRGRLLAHLRRGLPGAYVELEFYRNATAMLRAEKAAIAEGPLVNYRRASRHKSWKVRNYA